MKNVEEIEACVVEAEFHLETGTFDSVEEFRRCVLLNLHLIAMLPKVARAKSALFAVSEGKHLRFVNETGQELFSNMAAKPLRLMAAYQGARFNPWVELYLEACQHSPHASTMMFNEAIATSRTPRQCTAYDMANALNGVVGHVVMRSKSEVFKENLRKWKARCQSTSKRVEVFTDRLAHEEPFIEMLSFCLIDPTRVVSSDLANYVLSIRAKLLEALRSRLGQVGRGAVLSARVVPEGIRFDMLLVGRASLNFYTENDVRDAWTQATEGRGRCFHLDGNGSEFAYRSMSASRHLPSSEHRRRFGLYFGMSSWLVNWECLGAGALTMHEFEAPTAQWPFPAQRTPGYLAGSISSEFNRMYGR
jgi:hypothetical protein